MTALSQGLIVMLPVRGILTSDPLTTALRKARYRNAKKLILIAYAGSLFTGEGYNFVKDALRDELKAYAYKFVILSSLGPIMQLISLCLYPFSYGMFFRKTLITVRNLGAGATRFELGINDYVWKALDVALFGELVPITNSSCIFVLKNETETGLIDTINSYAGNGG